jgi:hypothetical protein
MHESNVNPEDLERRAEEQAPVEEAGGGESEGFEQAEKQLIENAEGDLTGGDPMEDAFPPEEVNPEDHTIYGEADDARSAVDENPNP